MTVFGLLNWILFLAELAATQTRYTGDEKLIGEVQAVVNALQGVVNNPVYRNQYDKVPLEGGWGRLFL